MKNFWLFALLCVSGNAGAVDIRAFKSGNELLSYCTKALEEADFRCCESRCRGEARIVLVKVAN